MSFSSYRFPAGIIQLRDREAQILEPESLDTGAPERTGSVMAAPAGRAGLASPSIRGWAN